MSYSFFVSQPGEVRFRLDQGRFVENILAQWPDALIRSDPCPGGPDWVCGEIPMGTTRVEFAFPASGEVLLLEMGDLSEYAPIALWFRKLIPYDYELCLYDELAYHEAKLGEETTEQEIMEAMTSEPEPS